jgi:hypothetical protein
MPSVRHTDIHAGKPLFNVGIRTTRTARCAARAEPAAGTYCCVRTSLRPRPASCPVLSIHSPVSAAEPWGLDSQVCQAGRSSGMQKLSGTIWKGWAPRAWWAGGGARGRDRENRAARVRKRQVTVQGSSALLQGEKREREERNVCVIGKCESVEREV